VNRGPRRKLENTMKARETVLSRRPGTFSTPFYRHGRSVSSRFPPPPFSTGFRRRIWGRPRVSVFLRASLRRAVRSRRKQDQGGSCARCGVRGLEARAGGQRLRADRAAGAPGCRDRETGSSGLGETRSTRVLAMTKAAAWTRRRVGVGRRVAVTGLPSGRASSPRRASTHPSCSQYAIDAVRQKGLVWRRLAACGAGAFCAATPGSHGGFDPVR